MIFLGGFEGGWVWGSNPYEGKIIFFFFRGGGLSRAKPGGCTSFK
jgi:hypothetical protein